MPTIDSGAPTCGASRALPSPHRRPCTSHSPHQSALPAAPARVRQPGVCALPWRTSCRPSARFRNPKSRTLRSSVSRAHHAQQESAGFIGTLATRLNHSDAPCVPRRCWCLKGHVLGVALPQLPLSAEVGKTLGSAISHHPKGPLFAEIASLMGPGGRQGHGGLRGGGRNRRGHGARGSPGSWGQAGGRVALTAVLASLAQAVQGPLRSGRRRLSSQRERIAGWLLQTPPLVLTRVQELLCGRACRPAIRRCGGSWRMSWGIAGARRRCVCRTLRRAKKRRSISGEWVDSRRGRASEQAARAGGDAVVQTLSVRVAAVSSDDGGAVRGAGDGGRFFDCVVKRVVPDNASSMVVRASPTEPELNRTSREYADARGLFVHPARVRSPQDMARVENQVPYVRERWFAGEQPDFIKSSRSLCQLRALRFHGAHRSPAGESRRKTAPPGRWASAEVRPPHGSLRDAPFLESGRTGRSFETHLELVSLRPGCSRQSGRRLLRAAPRELRPDRNRRDSESPRNSSLPSFRTAPAAFQV